MDFVKKYQNVEFNGGYVQSYNAIAKAKDCVLLPIGERSRKIKWQVPRKANGWKFGFGRANVWYASEDNEELKAFLKSILSENYTVITASNGEEGLQHAVDDLPDLIISDVMCSLTFFYS